MNPLLYVDSYKIHHTKMYPDNMVKLYSNLTPRKSRIKGIDKVVFFGLQHFVLEYLIDKFNKEFFGNEMQRKSFTKDEPVFKQQVIEEYKRHCNVDTKHIEALWDLGYLPIQIKALPEGSRVPISVPCMTITNTHPDFGWLVNYLETLISAMIWQGITSATISYQYKQLLDKYAKETTGSTEGVQWQGHDFSMRGMSSVESAILSGMGHLLSFTGTDTIPAIYQLEDSYDATGLIGASVPATEHSVMCMGTKEAEIDTFRRLLSLYPEGILSVVSDTWNLWDVLTKYLPSLKNEILARNGKLVLRPDSGNPVDIICGQDIKSYKDIEDAIGYFEDDLRSNQVHGEADYEISTTRLVKVEDKIYELEADTDWIRYDKQYYHPESIDIKTKSIDIKPEMKGVIELLWDIFGGTTNEYGYKVLDSHIGAIYGDSITLDRAEAICKRLKAKGFASTNIVLGIGSYTYQYNTRDTFGFAMKATYGEIKHEWEGWQGENVWKETHTKIEAREIWKDPITDDGTKRSAKGLLRVDEVMTADSQGKLHHSTYVLKDQCTKKEEEGGALKTVFEDGKLVRRTTLEEIRNRLK